MPSLSAFVFWSLWLLLLLFVSFLNYCWKSFWHSEGRGDVPSVSCAPGSPLLLGIFLHIKPLTSSEPLNLFFSLPGAQAPPDLQGARLSPPSGPRLLPQRRPPSLVLSYLPCACSLPVSCLPTWKPQRTGWFWSLLSTAPARGLQEIPGADPWPLRTPEEQHLEGQLRRVGSTKCSCW